MGKMTQQQYRTYLAHKHGVQGKVFERPVQIKDRETGETLIDNTDVFSPRPFTCGSGAQEIKCPHCYKKGLCDPTKVEGIGCGWCGKWIDMKEYFQKVKRNKSK